MPSNFPYTAISLLRSVTSLSHNWISHLLLSSIFSSQYCKITTNVELDWPSDRGHLATYQLRIGFQSCIRKWTKSEIKVSNSMFFSVHTATQATNLSQIFFFEENVCYVTTAFHHVYWPHILHIDYSDCLNRQVTIHPIHDSNRFTIGFSHNIFEKVAIY